MPLPYFYRKVVPTKVYRGEDDLKPEQLQKRICDIRLTRGEARVIAEELQWLRPRKEVK